LKTHAVKSTCFFGQVLSGKQITNQFSGPICRAFPGGTHKRDEWGTVAALMVRGGPAGIPLLSDVLKISLNFIGYLYMIDKSRSHLYKGDYMEFGKLVGDSFTYGKEGLVGHYGKWIMLIILSLLPVIPLMIGVVFGVVSAFTAPGMLIPIIVIMIILAIILALPLLGYSVRLYRGENPAPDVNNWGALFSDGSKLFIILFIYAIPVIIIGVVVMGSALLTIVMGASQSLANPGDMMGLIGAVLFGIIILAIVAFIIWLIEATAVVRFARTNSLGEAFNFGEIFARIGKIGTGSYILALIIQAIIVFVILFILELIPYIGFILVLIVTPVIMLFQARYLCLLYDSAGAEAPAPA